MNYIVLDDFPPWMIYLPGVVVLGAFLLALSLLLRRLRRAPEPAGRKQVSKRSNLPVWIFTCASAAALWFMASSMFEHFHAIGFDPLHVELQYLWPQPSVMLDRSEVADLKLVRGARTCGHLELLTRREVYASVNFKRCENANLLLKELPVGGRR